MKLNSLKDMVADYERRTGEKVNFDGFRFDDVNGGFHDAYGEYFKFFDGVGFVFWHIAKLKGKRYFVIGQTYGNFRKMAPYMAKVMKENGLTDIITATTRPPGVHERRWGMRHLSAFDYTYEGRRYRVLESDISHLFD